MISDIICDNKYNFIIVNKDIEIHKGEGTKLIALRNYLKRNKSKIIELTEEGIKLLIFSKCLELDLDMSLIRYKTEMIKQGVIDITILTGGL